MDRPRLCADKEGGVKKICYFKRGDTIPEGAVYLCVRKKRVKDTWEYEDVLVYEVPDKEQEDNKI